MTLEGMILEQKFITGLIEFMDTAEYVKNHDLSGLEAGQHPELYAHRCGDSRCDPNALAKRHLNHTFGTGTIGNSWLGVMGSAAYPSTHIRSMQVINNSGHISCGAANAAYALSKTLAPNISEPNDLMDAIAKTWAAMNEGKMSRRLVHTDSDEAIEEEIMPIAQFYANIRGIIGEDTAPLLVRHAIANVHLQVYSVLKMKQLRQRVANKELLVIGTFYDFIGKLGDRGNMYLVNVNGDFKNLSGIAGQLGKHSKQVLSIDKL
ncbi:MAG: carbonic anhydrase [Candidatus Woesearchaeota archaeon]